MKTMKKILALVLALTLCLGLCVSGFATGGEGNPVSPKYTIQINDAISGQTYTAYKIFDAVDGTPTDAEVKKVSYTIDDTSEWFSVVKAYKVDGYNSDLEGLGDTKVDTGYVVLTKINGTTTWSVTASKGVEANSEAAAAAFAKYLAVNTEGKHGTTVTATPKVGAAEGSNEGEASIDVEGEGYYFVNTSLGALTSLNTLTGTTVEIKEKNTEPTIEKKVQEDSKVGEEGEWGDKNTADIGQIVNFKSTVKIEKGAAKSIILHDTMSAGLSFINETGEGAGKSNNLKIKVNGVAVDSSDSTWKLIYPAIDADAEAGTPACTFDVVFNDSWIKNLLDDNLSDTVNYVDIIVEYSAIVNNEAVIGGTGNDNETHLSYGENSKVTSTTDSTKTYVYNFNVFKYTKDNGADVALPGAEFVLSKTENEVPLYAQVVNGILTGWTDSKDAANVKLTSGETGYISIKGLDAGTYSLEETKAPDGYNMLDKPIAVVISGPATNDDGGKVTQDGEETSSMGEGEDAITNIVKVENKSGTLLPSTGGIGTTIFYVVGGILMLGAVILLITKKKMGSKQ